LGTEVEVEYRRGGKWWIVALGGFTLDSRRLFKGIATDRRSGLPRYPREEHWHEREKMTEPLRTEQGRVAKAVSVTLALVLISVFLLALVAGTIWLWKSIAGSDSELLIGVVTASATVLVSVIGIAFGRYNERKKEIEQRRQEKRIPVYEKFTDFWFVQVLYGQRLGKGEIEQKDLLAFFAEFTRDLMLWGSDEVILEWGEVRRQWAALGDDAARTKQAYAEMLNFESLLLAIRRDIGYPKTKLRQGSILGLFIDDIDSVLSASRSRSPGPTQAPPVKPARRTQHRR
jgi:hypothetical protein